MATETALRRFVSLLRRIAQQYDSFLVRAEGFLNSQIQIGKDCSFGRGAQLRATDCGSIVLGARVSLGAGVQIIAQYGQVLIGDDVYIGMGSIVACKENVVIGSGTQIAEYVVIRDQDHRFDTRPIRSAGFRTAAISIGRDVWIGAKASILRGGSVGDRSIIGAHALVRTVIANDVLAVGVPAKVIRSLSDGV